MSFKNASVSALDAGGSRGTSCTADSCAPAKCGELPRRCASTVDPGSSTAGPSSAEADVSVGV
jgi:hypothetical protein